MDIIITNKNKTMETIKEKKLSDANVLNIVKEWYLNMYSYILQDESGNDLEEICDYQIQLITNKNK